jgi:integrase
LSSLATIPSTVAGSSYVEYARAHLYPAFGDVPVGRVTAEVLEEFYAELRRCRSR